MESLKLLNAIDDYQAEAKRTLADDNDLTGLTLGLVGEAGEFADAVKKLCYHSVTVFGKREVDFLTHAEEEMGDVLWYLANLCNYLGLSLDTVARKNLEKLEARYPQGFIRGGGIR